jgi:hypothetical protein
MAPGEFLTTGGIFPTGIGIPSVVSRRRAHRRDARSLLDLTQEPAMNRSPCLTALLGTLVLVNAGSNVSGQSPQGQVLAPTFSEHVAPIVYAKCIQCHRPGEVAPMSLINYHDVQPWAGSIRRQLVEQTMPPFHSHSRYGLLVSTPRLTQAEIYTVVRWVDAGAPEGNPALLPELPIVAPPGRNAPAPPP